ncbi:hypothetical protein OGAPHI_005005 [Ogataea philodendri]|uniref:Knr4/Smi1-like domain-containing protein n=1 Tax=Ogataea philodendri TaxID=1378263 RepID=A0A9P8T2W9_9ASCO|nr:uncharacterized protein OGAPHI_005005 [Ogataea philodendri]KAH3663604.1 hypothetical protein OGAPHI_005005 [Ogataea philodendri]
MGLLKEIQGFFHSVTTNDHYAAYNTAEPSHLGSSTGHESSQSISMLDNTSSTSLAQFNSRSARNSTSNRPVQYRPGMRSQLNGSDIQMQDYIEGQPPLPSVAAVWEKLDTWMENEFPELGDDMENGATVNDLNAFEEDLSISLPFDVRESIQIHDGQLNLGKKRGLVYGYPLMDLETIAAEVNIWRKVGDRLQKTTEQYASEQILMEGQDKAASTSSFHVQKTKHFAFLDQQKSVPRGAVQEVYYHNQWIPLVKDNEGNNIALDLAPGPKGRWGQIILFGRDFDTKYVVASCFTEFLLNLAEDLEDGKFYIDEIDEDLVYLENGKTHSYFEVLKFRSLALAKSMVGSRLPIGKSGSSVSLLGSPSLAQTQLPRTHSALNDSFVVEDEDQVIPGEDVIKPETSVDEVAGGLKEVDLIETEPKDLIDEPVATETVDKQEQEPETAVSTETEAKEELQQETEPVEPVESAEPAEPTEADSAETADKLEPVDSGVAESGSTDADAEEDTKPPAETTTPATKSKPRKKKNKKSKK